MRVLGFAVCSAWAYGKRAADHPVSELLAELQASVEVLDACVLLSPTAVAETIETMVGVVSLGSGGWMLG